MKSNESWKLSPELGDADMFRILAPDGGIIDGHEPKLGLEETIDALKLMLLTRAFDERAFKLQRQGRFGTFSQVRGQEAAIVGSASAIDPVRDWVVPQYRELPALLRQGFPLERFILYFSGDPAGGYVPEGVNCLPINIALASQIPHAVGLAWGLRHQGSDSVVIAYFGDGASSEGDAHEAMNLAGIVKAPVVFFLSNNGWAISTPVERQSATHSFASRGPGYGFPGARVDGNDLLAVHSVTSEAVERARAGDGPTLIEAVTYRMGPHNTADDPTRYVGEEELNHWRPLDPVDRVRRYLEGHGVWDEASESQALATAKDKVEAAFAAASAFPSPDPDQLFRHLFAEPPARLEHQRAALNETG